MVKALVFYVAFFDFKRVQHVNHEKSLNVDVIPGAWYSWYILSNVVYNEAAADKIY